MGEPMNKVWTADELMRQDFGRQRWCVPNLIPEGLLVLAAKSKIGKSYLVLPIAIAVATGGTALGVYQAEQGDVLYLDLDQPHPRRTQHRLRGMLRGTETTPERLYIANRWERLPHGIDDIKRWIDSVQSPRMVVIDTMQPVWPTTLKGSNAYYAEADVLMGLVALAASVPGMAVVAVHHESKPKGKDDGDPWDMISGSAAWAAKADTLWNLSRIRTRGKTERRGTLTMTGKEIDDRTLKLLFAPDFGCWFERPEGVK